MDNKKWTKYSLSGSGVRGDAHTDRCAVCGLGTKTLSFSALPLCAQQRTTPRDCVNN